MAHNVVLFIQPAYNYATKKIEYAEVLIRKYRGIEGVPNILKFVSRNNIEDVFDIDILRETLHIMSSCGSIDYPIGVNVCSTTACKDGIAERIIYEIDSYGVSHDRIVIEVNEETDFSNVNVKNNIKKLRDSGIKIALDDFGVKNSNLYSLMTANIDIIKVDRMFVDGAQTKEAEDSQNAILKVIMQLCDTLNIKHIVEGIETNKQLKNIQSLGYSVVQGYLYQKPTPFGSEMIG